MERDHSAEGDDRATKVMFATSIDAIRADAVATSSPCQLHTHPSRKVVGCSGHMTDRPDRPVPRFPAGIENDVRAAMAARLDAWEIGPEDLAVTGAARGADILFAELCLDRCADVRLLLAMPEEQFVERSVRLPGTAWEARYRSLIERCEVWYRSDEPALAQPSDAFDAVNRWILDTCHAEASPDRFYIMLVWDEVPIGDGVGGTADFARAAERYDACITIVNPLRISRAGANEHGTR